MPTTSREIALGPDAVGYTLVRRPRRSIGFVVGPQGLAVHAPASIRVGTIEAAIRARAGWILAKLAEQRERAQQADHDRIDWRDGGTLRLLGRTIVLRLDAGLARATCAEGRLGLPLPADAPPGRVAAAAERWLRAEALRVFGERCAHFGPRLGVRPTRLQLSTARTRWGSASADGSIRLNLGLIHQPLEQVDYVVVHELAHLREMNHGPRFWALVGAVMPDHRARRHALRSVPVPCLSPARPSDADPPP